LLLLAFNPVYKAAKMQNIFIPFNKTTTNGAKNKA